MLTINQSLQRLIYGSAIASFFFIPCNPVLAQITPDSTLGAEQSSILPNGVVIDGVTADLIQDGASRGSALFHSFLEFNINEGQRVYFANPDGIEAIFSRVTGTDPSDILGTLGVNGAADLIFINPNGILFGENAQLDIRGSFIGSTANGVVFENGTTFSATNPEAPPLLTINLTPGLQYGSNHPGRTITNSGNLAVGQDLTLASAGNLDLQGQLQAGGKLTLFATDTVKMRDSVANPFIAAALGQLLVQGNQSIDIFALNHPDSGLFSGGDMILRSANTVAGDAHYWSGGNFQIEQLDGSLGNLLSPDDPIIRSRGDVRFNSYRGSSLHILAGGQVRIGQVEITGTEAGQQNVDYLNEDVTLSNGQVVRINGRERPTLDVRAGVEPAAVEPPGVTGKNPVFDVFNSIVGFGSPTLTNTPTNADITIGRVSINKPNSQVLITNQYKPNTELSGTIQVKDIYVNDSDGAFLIGFKGDGGDIFLDSRGDISIPNAGEIVTDSATGDAGDITMLARNSISLSDDVKVRSVTNGSGRGGDIKIQAGSLFITDNAQLVNSTFGTGDAGDVNINVTNTIFLRDSNIFSTVEAGAVGNEGDITIQTGSLSLIDGSQLATVVFGLSDPPSPGKEKAGNIRINARDTITILGNDLDGRPSGIFTALGFGAVGIAGDIELEADSIRMDSDGVLWTASEGQGDAGDIKITADSISLNDGSRLLARTYREGDAGDVDIQARTLSLTNGSRIYTDSTFNDLSAGKAGSIQINAEESVTLSGVSSIYGYSSGLYAGNSDGSNAPAGEIEVTTGTFRITDGAVIENSTSNSSDGATVTINSDTLELTGGGQILAVTHGSGKAGTINLNVTDNVTISGSDSTYFNRWLQFGPDIVINEPFARNLTDTTLFAPSGLFAGGSFTASGLTGNGGTISINDTQQLTVSNNGQISTAAFGTADGGNVSIRRTGAINVSDRGIIFTAAFGRGNIGTSPDGGVGGELFIDTESLIIRDQSQVFSGTGGAGTGGNLTIKAANSVEVINNSLLTTDTISSGNAGNLTIETRNLTVGDGAGISSSTQGAGQGGILRVDATDFVTVDNRGVITTYSAGTGDAGHLEINTDKLEIQDESVISSNTLSSGTAGDLTVQATDSVEVINGSRLLADTLEYSSGDGGNLTVKTGKLSIRNNSEVRASTALFTRGQAGTINVDASDSVEISGSSALFTLTGGSGRASDMIINTGKVIATDGGRIEAGTLGIAPGGNLTVNASESIALRGSSLNGSFRSGLSAFSLTLGNARSGNLTVNTGDFTIDDGAEVTVTSLKGQAGNADITANLLWLNQGYVTAETRLGEGEGGANIFLQLDEDLILRNESLISATAFEEANGGNITLNTRFVIALPPEGPEGSDIIANAFLGDGGRVNVTAEYLFDIDFRDRRTPLNDITASSEFGEPGVVTIETPGIDPNAGLVQLPPPASPPEFVNFCQGRSDQTPSHFIISGRGGVPPTISQVTGTDNVWEDLRPLTPNSDSRPAKIEPVTQTRSTPIIEAQGFLKLPDGTVVLTAQAPNVTPHPGWQNPIHCQSAVE